MAQILVHGAAKGSKFQSPPFTIRLLSPLNQHDGVDHLSNSNDPFLNLFPASYCTKSDDLVPSSHDYSTSIASELDIQRLNKIHRWLWVAGTALPARSLHDQIFRGREVVITEAMDMHLVWTTGKIYIKPIPRFFARADCVDRYSPSGFVRQWDRYSAFFHSNLGWLAATTVYMVVVLTSMQVGLATEILSKSNAFQSASYGFTVFSILGPLICAGLIVVVFACSGDFSHRTNFFLASRSVEMEVALSAEQLVILSSLSIAFFWLAYQLSIPKSNQTTNLRNRRHIDVLYDPEDDAANPKRATVDIVAVHGLSSNVDRTWTWRPGQPEVSVHWLRDNNMLRSKVPNARIMVFNYDSTWISDAPKTRVELCGEELIRSLHNFRQDSDRPIVFVAHSFGGLVVQDGLIFADREREFKYILDCTAGFVSLGTPFRGTGIYWAADLTAAVIRFFGSHRGVLSLLLYDSPQLRDKTQNLGRLRRTFPFPIFCFFELFQTTFIRLPFLSNIFRGIVVAEASACVSGDERLQLQTDHIELNKYSGPEDRSYLSVSAEIAKMCNNASTVVNSHSTVDDPLPSGHWVVPFEQNEGFVGRENYLNGILERISPASIKNACQRTVVEGLGGVGKTQIVLEAAFRLRKRKPACSVFWVPAIDMIGIRKAYSEIARSLGIQVAEDSNASTLEQVKVVLSNQNMGEWLLVIDNADDPTLLFEPSCLTSHLPSSPLGSIVFTTRTSEITSRLDVPLAGIFLIGAMNKHEAIALMGTKLSKSQMADMDSIEALLEVLTYLPLGAKQAAAYMQKTKTTPAKYLQLCEMNDESFSKLLTKDFEDRSRRQNPPYDAFVQNAVAKTWLISFEHVLDINPIAGDILKFACFLSEKNVPLSIFPPVHETAELDEAIGVLQSYAFITLRDDGSSFDMDRLVRLATRNWLEENGDFVQVYEPVLLRMRTLFSQPAPDSKADRLKYLSHALSVLDNNARSSNDHARCGLLWSVCIALLSEGMCTVALGLIHQAQMIATDIYTENDPMQLGVRAVLDQILFHLGRGPDAIETQRESLEAYKKTFGEEDELTKSNMSHFAHNLLEIGRYQEAEEILLQLLQIQERDHGEASSIDIILTRFYLTLCRYQEPEQLAREMEQLAQEWLRVQKSASGKQHQNFLVMIYFVVWVDTKKRKKHFDI
ncbi:hypothetical protein FLONG3_7861 [Fusarium longipes]|uniref:DUF676 domain-containing protein n=1 Tax=Fusarium longipes TaxID=694270 RepID=A0A395SAG6_9HYPO|nr:hypothetical protein FLONG3_7861 [Fusarium longipes]